MSRYEEVKYQVFRDAHKEETIPKNGIQWKKKNTIKVESRFIWKTEEIFMNRIRGQNTT